MNPSLIGKLDAMAARHAELTALLSDPDVIGDQARYRTLSREHARLDKVVAHYREYDDCRRNLAQTIEMLDDRDAEVKALAQQESETLKRAAERGQVELLLAVKSRLRAGRKPQGEK